MSFSQYPRGRWGQLQAEGTKESVLERRQKSIREFEEYQQQQRDLIKERRKKVITRAYCGYFLSVLTHTWIKNQEAENVMHMSWAIEDERKQAVRKAKEAERAAAEKDLDDWNKQENFVPESKVEQEETKNISVTTKTDSRAIWAEGEAQKAALAHPLPKKAVKPVVLPPPRKRGGKVEVSFTHRDVNTPAREGPDAERERYLAKAKKDAELAKEQDMKANPDALGIDEQHPAFLKDRGDKLYQGSDLLGAISAYTTAIQVTLKKNPEETSMDTPCPLSALFP